MRSLWLTSLAAVALASPLFACSDTECGVGTIESNGDCVPADDSTTNGMCGAGTVLENGVCVGAVSCDPETTTPEAGAGGKITCKGSGGGVVLPACDQPLPCPAAAATNTSMCGRLIDLE